MAIEYREVQVFQPVQLQDLFLAVDWEIGQQPDKLARALANSGVVFSAWDADRLIGLINALDDGIVAAYVHFLLVHPEYQGQGIGKELIRLMTDHYRDVMRIVLVSDDRDAPYYQDKGFQVASGTQTLMLNR